MRLRLTSLALVLWLTFASVKVVIGVIESDAQHNLDSESFEYFEVVSRTEQEFLLNASAPKNLRLLDVSSGVTIAWDKADDAVENEVQLSLSLLPELEFGKLSQHGEHDESPSPLTLVTNESFVALDDVTKLEPGRSYNVQLNGEVELNFTVRPNPPDRFVVWYRNESSFLILWQPPTSGYFELYKAEIFPRESTAPLFVSRWDYQFGGVRPGFSSLFPGRAYNISVCSVSQGVESTPTIKEYRTMPLKVTNVSVELVELKQGIAIVVEWVPPLYIAGEYDGFNTYIKRDWGKPSQKFVPRSKPPRAVLEVGGLISGQEYTLVVKTVSGKVSSHPVYTNFHFNPTNINTNGTNTEI